MRLFLLGKLSDVQLQHLSTCGHIDQIGHVKATLIQPPGMFGQRNIGCLSHLSGFYRISDPDAASTGSHKDVSRIVIAYDTCPCIIR